MKDFVNILDQYSKLDLREKKAALATVVKVRGSSYRSPGARMLITEEGKWYGSVSGGCLEGDVLRKARQVMHDQRALTITYDTREDSNQNLGINLGCNGVIDILIEPVTTDGQPLDTFAQLSSSTEPVAIATIFNSSTRDGQKLIIKQNGSTIHEFNEPELTASLLSALMEVFKTRKSYTQQYDHYGNTLEIFIELVEPTISIIIFGGGFDARPVSILAKSLGWNVSVTDECVAHIAPLFFPTADKLSLCQREFVDRDFSVTSHTACVLMSHNYEYDRDVLKKLLKINAPYIGILGPRKRFDKMLEEFLTEGIELGIKDMDRIHSPIGLDIAAETPDEIAVSIISEIQAKLHRRSGGFLKYRNAPIHERDNNGSIVLKQSYII
ncbi:MAG TPA: XdhC/CoxI family protein [Cyclobacteriaceae bacterium]